MDIQIDEIDETTIQEARWQRSATLLALAFACTAEYWTTASVSLTLTDFGGTLGASSDEASWALTIYTTAFAVAIALSHRFSVVFGNRKYLAVCSLLYASASLGCALSPDLPVFLIFRALGGLAGGAFLVRTFVFFTQRIEIDHRAAIATSFFVELMIVGRFVPYLTSGWLADNITWRLQFVFPAICALVSAGLFWKFTPAYWRKSDYDSAAVDVRGIALLVVGVCALQIALSRGVIDDWFESSFIRTLFLLGILANAAFLIWQLSSRNQAPLLDIHYVRERSVYAGGVLGFALGLLLSGSLYAIPQYLRTIETHSALQTGVLLSISSAIAAVSVWLLRFAQPVMKRLGSRWALAIAFGAAMLSEFILGRVVTPDTPDYLLWAPLALNGVFIALSIPTLGVAVFAFVSEEETSSARAIFYGMRQFGASVGVTLSVGLIDRRSSLHSGRLLEGFFDRGLAPLGQSRSLSIESLKELELLVRKQSLVLAFADNFNVMAVLAGLSLLAIPLLPITRAAPPAIANSSTPRIAVSPRNAQLGGNK